MKRLQYYLLVVVTLALILFSFVIIDLGGARVSGPTHMQVESDTFGLWHEEVVWFYRYTCLLLMYSQIVVVLFANRLFREEQSGKRTPVFWCVSIVAAIVFLGGTVFQSIANLDVSHNTQLTVVLLLISSVVNSLVFGYRILVPGDSRERS